MSTPPRTGVIYVIEQGEANPVGLYFSPKMARQLGSHQGWSPEIKDALQFAREVEAKAYVNKHLTGTHARVVARPM